MKRIIYASTIVPLFLAVIFLCSCKTEGQLEKASATAQVASIEATSSIIEKLTFEEIDLISREAAQFHDYAVLRLVNELHDKKDIYDEKYHEKVFKFLYDASLKYPFKYMDSRNFSESFIKIVDYKMIERVVSRKERDFTMYKNNYTDTELITKKCREIEARFDKLLHSASSLKELVQSYDDYIAKELTTVKNKYDYLCIRAFSDTYASSFLTWGKYEYERENGEPVDMGPILDWLKKVGSAIAQTAVADADGFADATLGAIDDGAYYAVPYIGMYGAACSSYNHWR